ncbi:LacI family DNA-binding transcriptional regulator [Secundilactobacillus muriivasis]
MVTMRDIAKRVGISVSTVSRYVNRSGYVSAKTGARIQAVIDATQFVPNTIARDLSKGHTLNIGVIVPHLNHPYFSQLLAGIVAAAFESSHHYQIVLLQSNYDSGREMAYLEQLQRRTYNGLIFTSHAIALADMLPYQQYGAIVCCEDPGTIDLAAAFATRTQTYLAAFRRIRSLGYRRIGILLSRNDDISPTSQHTSACFQTVFGSSPIPELLQTNVTTYQDGYRVAGDYLSRNLQPEMIFTNGDDVAAGVAQRYQEAKQQVPPLMGQENQLSSRLLNIPTIDHHFERVGRLAFGLAESQQVQRIAVDSQLIRRGWFE